MLVTEIDRFMEKVMPEPNSGCWLWTASLGTWGYGQFRPTGWTTMEPAHRTAYRLFVGHIPMGMHLDHKCRIKCCVNPAHLEAVTPGENVRRGLAGHKQRARTHCPRGHDYSAVNTYRASDGKRHCRICKRNQTLASYHAKIAAGYKRINNRWTHVGN